MNIGDMLRSGEISPLSFAAFVTVVLSLIVNIFVAKWRGYRLKPAIAAAFIPYINIYFSCAYLFLAMFKKDFIQSS